jgi:hypothetical protein
LPLKPRTSTIGPNRKSRKSSVWQAPSKKKPPPESAGLTRHGTPPSAKAAGSGKRCVRQAHRQPHLADRALRHEVAHGEEAGQGAAVEAHPERDAGRAAGGDHVQALAVVHPHRLLDVHRLAGRGAAQRVLAVAVGERGDVDGVDVVGVDDGRRVVVGAGDAVPAGIVGGERAIAAHHRAQLGMARLREARAALALGHVAATDHAPTDGFHRARRRVPKSVLATTSRDGIVFQLDRRVRDAPPVP